ncbi:hypothetical protein LX73_1582 [Fodinibius salinus]|uniref:Uncharacterized protein n=1 Tax=Fodinibius salinus TaxID=860790 RepID=A0A5D3YMF0_9BACT|nr:hypothetical protein [Fodinibius salinus]TYP93867.1 hypothetical protein LX73_1582 [Fodinibius salinus]
MKVLREMHLSIIILAVAIIGCSSMGTIQGDASKVYSEKYSRMGDVVEQAINNRSLSIQSINEPSSGDKVVIKFSKPIKTSSQDYSSENVISGDIAEVIIEKVDTKKTRITIFNPEYHYSVSSSERKEYAKQLMNDIDEILGR